MATKKNSKQPTAKQLRARANFTKMVRARAKAAKAAKRTQVRVAKNNCASGARRKNKTVIKAKRALVVKPNGTLLGTKKPKRVANKGIRLSAREIEKLGPAARAALGSSTSTSSRSSGATSKSVRVNSSRSRKAKAAKRQSDIMTGYLSRGTHKRAATRIMRKSRRSLRRMRNSATPGAVQQLHTEFIGRVSTSSREVEAPANAPAHLVQAGILTRLVTSKETFNFTEDEKVALAIDAKGKLHIVGTINPPLEKNADFGKLQQVGYVTAKPHLTGGKKYEWVHRFGEEGGTEPQLKSDSDGRLRIVGGTYYITPEGIAD